ncbi:hypothetical protein PENCOP_c016G04465 [Penicillium coprophilum]|uniref:Tyrosinase C-terminal domain-containing protein n=1 Tax=Penicillium coprophilum TaxID=36646 RepID=A0A1V6U859_9EURO|nr:hypothetical protein PENCOP_c016G04465 [Penicillium coprophilum]
MNNIPADNATIRDSFGKEHIVDGNTPLQPFRRDAEGNYWTPEAVQFPSNLGYSYPELLRWEGKYRHEDGTLNQVLFNEDINTIVNTLYGVFRDLVLDPKAPTPEGVEAIDGGFKITDFAFSVRFLKYALGGQPFWVKLYLAQENGIQTPLTDLIAEVYNFSQKPELDGSSVCGNCTQDKCCVSNQPLTFQLHPCFKSFSGVDVKSLTRDEILAYIKKRAYWRIFKNERELPRYEVEKLELEIIGSSNYTKHFTNPATPPAFENFKKEPPMIGSADGAEDPELKQSKIDPPASRANIPLNENLRFQLTIKTDSVILLESSSVDPVKPDGGVDMAQISIMDAAKDIIFHISIRRERIDIAPRFSSKDGATILIHDQGEGFEVSIDWVRAIWFAKRAQGRTPQSIQYDIYSKDGASALSEYLEVRTYPSMKALFLQKHAHEEEK